MLVAVGAFGAIEGNPDQRMSLTLSGGLTKLEGDWTSMSGDPPQNRESVGSGFGIGFKIPVSRNATIFLGGSMQSSESRGLGDVFWYGTTTEMSGWNVNGGVTIYFGD